MSSTDKAMMLFIKMYLFGNWSNSINIAISSLLLLGLQNQKVNGTSLYLASILGKNKKSRT